MNLWNRLSHRLRTLFRKGKIDAEMAEEMRTHLERWAETNRAAGLSPEDARHAAQRQFGHVDTIVETARDQRGWVWLEQFGQDLRYAMRQLAKAPGFTFVAVCSLALGIGACTAVYSLFDAILLRSLPVPNPQELRVLMWSGTNPKIQSFSGHSSWVGKRRTGDAVNHPLFLNLRKQVATLADVFGFSSIRGIVVRGPQDAFEANGLMVSGNFFPALGVKPFMGRLFQPGDENPASGPNAVITYAWWESHFAHDPGVLGQPVTLNGNVFTVVGVLPRDFTGVNPGDPQEFYVPMQAGSPFLFAAITAPGHWFVRLMARINPGVADAQLQSAFSVVFVREAGAVMQEPTMQLQAGRGGMMEARDRYRQPLQLMGAAVGLFMLIACANLAGLSLARGAAREHELAVRAALGSGRWRLFRQALAESLLLALLGSVLGCLLAGWGKIAIAHLLARSTDGLHYDLSLNFPVLGFTLAAAVVTALLSGLLPAWRAGQVNPLDGLKARGALAAPRLRVVKTLVAAQIGISLLILTCAGLYLRSLANLGNINAGFRTDNVMVFQLNPSGGGYKGAQLTAFYSQAQEALSNLPGVQGASLVRYPLMSDSVRETSFSLPGHPTLSSGDLQTQCLTVGETFFSTLGIPIIQGRGFSPTDIVGAPRALVTNDAFRRKYFPAEDTLGQTVNINGVEWKVVGVCGDTKYDNIKSEVRPTIYTSFRQDVIDNSTAFVVRTALPPSSLATAVRQAVAVIDPNVPVTHLTTQNDLRDANIGQERLLASLCAVLAMLALLLSCIGLYGLMAYHVARRTGEIAIRLAVGAQPGDVARAILNEAFKLAMVGIAIGLPVAFVAARLLKSQLFGVQPADPTTLGLVVLILLAVALLAAWIPARRAIKIDPMLALRCE